jgi:hypothetical protein
MAAGGAEQEGLEGESLRAARPKAKRPAEQVIGDSALDPAEPPPYCLLVVHILVTKPRL